MAASPINIQLIFHARSASFPSRSHPVSHQIDEHLRRTKATEAASSSSSAVNSNLSCLRDLCDCVDNLLIQSSTQKSLNQDSQKKEVDKVLDGLLSTLDICGRNKDALAQIKEHVHQLLSILRRRRGNESELAKKAEEYLKSRKLAKKEIHKSLRHLKSKGAISAMAKDREVKNFVDVLSNVQAVTFNAFESLLSFLSGSKARAKPSGWSLASKLMHSKLVNSEVAPMENEFTTVDVALTLIGLPKATKSKNLQGKLEVLESCIRHLESELDCIYRQLIKIRVSLLNTLSY